MVILGAGLEAKSFAKFFFRFSQILRVNERGAQVMMAEARLRVKFDCSAQHVHRLAVFTREQKGLAQDATFGGSAGVFGNSGPQLANGRWIITLRHVGARQAVVTTFPVGILTIEVFELRDGGRSEERRVGKECRS